MASTEKTGAMTPAGVAILGLAVLFPLGPRFATPTGNIYLATVLTLLWLSGWVVFVFAGPGRGLSLRHAPQQALLVYGTFLVVHVLLFLETFTDRPEFLLRAIQLLAYMALFAGVSSLNVDRNLLRRLIWLSLVVFLVESVLALRPGQSSAEGFLTGTFDKEHNSFAAYVLLLVCLFFAKASLTPRRLERGLLVLLMVVGLALLTFAFSRTAYVAVPIALLAIVHRRWGGRSVLLATLFMLAIVILLGLLVRPEVRERFTSIVQVASGGGQDVSYNTRLALWRNAFDRLIETGFLGVGLYGFHYLDNYFVRALVETGPIGFVLFLWFLGTLLLWLWRRCDVTEDSETRAVSLGLYGATVGLLVVMNLASDQFLVHRVMGLYWLLLGVLVANAGDVTKVSNRPQPVYQ
jgi:O-antigen ligase